MSAIKVVPGQGMIYFIRCTACSWRGERIMREGSLGTCPKCGAEVERRRSAQEAKLDRVWQQMHGGAQQ